MICKKCGTYNTDGSKFCTQCGSTLQTQPDKKLKSEDGSKSDMNFAALLKRGDKKNKDDQRQKIRTASWIVIVSMLILISVCIALIVTDNTRSSQADSPSGAVESNQNRITPTPTPKVTETPAPTATPEPTPTATPEPTPTLAPTATPEPTPDMVEETNKTPVIVAGGIEADPDDFLFPYSSSSYIDYSELDRRYGGLSQDDRHYYSQLAIDEIFFRYGWTFGTSNMTSEKQRMLDKMYATDWYSRARAYYPEEVDWYDFMENYMNDYERTNIDTINQWQQNNGVYY